MVPSSGRRQAYPSYGTRRRLPTSRTKTTRFREHPVAKGGEYPSMDSGWAWEKTQCSGWICCENNASIDDNDGDGTSPGRTCPGAASKPSLGLYTAPNSCQDSIDIRGIFLGGCKRLSSNTRACVRAYVRTCVYASVADTDPATACLLGYE